MPGGFAAAVQLPIRAYTVADGLPRNQVECIVPDSRGFVWFCTPEGLARFDGYEFRTYGVNDGLPDRWVYAFLESREGPYLIGTQKGLAVLNPATTRKNGRIFENYSPAGGGLVQTLFQDRRGRIWCAAGMQLFRVKWSGPRLEFQEVPLPALPLPNEGIHDIVDDPSGAIWLAATEGLFRIPDGGVAERYTTANGLPSEVVHALACDRSGTVWAGSHAGLYRLFARPDAAGRIVDRTFTTRDGLGAARIASLLADDGGLWVGTIAGLSRWTGATGSKTAFTTYQAREGVTDVGVDVLSLDRDGNLWFATSEGPKRMRRSGLSTYTTQDGVGGLNVAAFEEDRHGGVFALTQSADTMDLNRAGQERFARIHPAFPANITYFGWASNQVAVLDRQENWWFPTGQGLCRFPKVASTEDLSRTPPLKVYTKADGLPADEVFRLFEDSRGDMWMSTLAPQAISRWERKSGRVTVELRSFMPTAFAESSDGTIWAGNGAQLARRRNGRFELLPSGTAPEAYALHFDRSGRFWIGGHQGLFRCDDPAAESPVFRAILPESVRGITEDLPGRIYACTGRGILRIDPATGAVKRYTSADGLVRGETQTAYCDRQGRLWFGTRLGLSMLIPERDEKPAAISLLITGVRLAGRDLPVLETGQRSVGQLKVKAGQGPLEISYVGITHAPGEILRYQYRLEGAAGGWSEPTTQRTLTVAGLGAGSYRFLLRAADQPGQEASVDFVVLPPFWRTWWFVSATTAAVGLMLYALHRIRLARVTQIERVRSRIAMDLHDDIGASLSQIAVMSEVAMQQGARNGVLNGIATASRELVDSMSDLVWATDPQNDRVGPLIERMRWFASETLCAVGVRFQFTVQESASELALDPEMRRQALLVFKEAIHNIVRHARASEVQGWFFLENGWLEFGVQDNGCGFDCALPSNGRGLKSMGRRARSVGGAFSVQPGNGGGTCVSLRVPLAPGRRGQRFRELPN